MPGDCHACCAHCGKLVAGRATVQQAERDLQAWHDTQGCVDNPKAMNQIRALAAMHRRMGVRI